MQISLGVTKTVHLVHETISVVVLVTNDGPAPVRIPDPFHRDTGTPTYMLVGPAFPQRRT